MTKIIYRLIIFLIVAGASVFLFFYLLKGIQTPQLPEDQQIEPIAIKTGKDVVLPKENSEKIIIIGSTSTIGNTSTSEINSLEKISNGSVFDYAIISDEEIYYFSYDGRVFQAHQDGDLIISDIKMESLNSIEQEIEKKRVLVSFGDPINPKWSIYDLLDKTWRPLPDSIKYATWGENDQQLIGITQSGDIRSLSRIDLSKNTIKIISIISPFPLKGSLFSSSGKETILLIEKPSGLLEGGIKKIMLKTFEIQNVFEKLPGFFVKKSRNGGWWFWSSLNQKFGIFDGNKEKKELTIKTFPNKCGGKEIIYCFVPTNVPLRGVFPDDYLQNKFFSTDSLYKINPKTDEETLVLRNDAFSGKSIDAIQIFVSNQFIYFINKYDNALYRIKF